MNDELGRLSEDESGWRSRSVAVEFDPIGGLYERADGGAGLRPREVSADTRVRTTYKSQMLAHVGTIENEPVGARKDLRVAVRPKKRNTHEIAPLDRRAAQADVLGGVSINDRSSRCESQRLFDHRRNQIRTTSYLFLQIGFL